MTSKSFVLKEVFEIEKMDFLFLNGTWASTWHFYQGIVADTKVLHRLLLLPGGLHQDFSLLLLKLEFLVKLLSRSLLQVCQCITKTLEYFPFTSAFFLFLLLQNIFLSQPLNSSRAAVKLLRCAFTVSLSIFFFTLWEFIILSDTFLIDLTFSGLTFLLIDFVS